MSSEGERLTAFGDALIRLHDEFRRDLAEIRRDVAGELTTHPSAVVGRELRTHCLTFCERLHEHHGVEDAVLFPHLAHQHPELSAVLDRLRAEHGVVARGVQRLQSVLADGGTSSRELADEVDRIATALEAHLDYEEEQLVGVLNALTTLPEGV